MRVLQSALKLTLSESKENRTRWLLPSLFFLTHHHPRLRLTPHKVCCTLLACGTDGRNVLPAVRLTTGLMEGQAGPSAEPYRQTYLRQYTLESFDKPCDLCLMSLLAPTRSPELLLPAQSGSKTSDRSAWMWQAEASSNQLPSLLKASSLSPTLSVDSYLDGGVK